MNKREIGKRLRQLRGEIPRETVAKAVGVTTTAIAMYENGNRIPRDPTKIALAQFFGKSIESIFFDIS
jgi:putative transcriptional regulator